VNGISVMVTRTGSPAVLPPSACCSATPATSPATSLLLTVPGAWPAAGVSAGTRASAVRPDST
jgi:hypothetical protein